MSFLVTDPLSSSSSSSRSLLFVLVKIDLFSHWEIYQSLTNFDLVPLKPLLIWIMISLLVRSLVVLVDWHNSFSSSLDLFLTIDQNNKPFFRIYELPISKLTLIKEYPAPSGAAIYHLSTFADIGKDVLVLLRYLFLSFLRQMPMENWNIFFLCVWTTIVQTVKSMFEITMLWVIGSYLSTWSLTFIDA